jgi:hypothetical protein
MNFHFRIFICEFSYVRFSLKRSMRTKYTSEVCERSMRAKYASEVCERSMRAKYTSEVCELSRTSIK